MSISSEITRITNNVQNTIDTIEATGVTVPDGANSDDLPSLAAALANEKQDKLTGTQGQVVGFDEDGNAVPQAAGVTSFNGRTGAVNPQEGDYTAEMVGARADDWVPTANDVGAVPTSRTVNGKALSADITLSAADVSARPATWTPSAADVGAVPIARTINSKPLSSDVTLTAEDVGAGEPAQTASVTLLSTGWSQSGDRYSQTVNCSIVAADTPVVVVDVALSGTDLDADNEALSAWAGPSACNVTQGAGALTFYSVEAPTVNIPVNVGVG